MIFRQNKLLVVMLVIGVIGSIWILAGRHKVEMSNRRVEISVDYIEVAEIAGAAGISVSDALVKLKESGASSVAVQEITFADLAATGAISIEPSNGGTLIKVVTTDLAKELTKSIPGLEPYPASVKNMLYIKAEPAYVLLQPVGLPKEALAAAKKAELPVVARLVNYPGVSPQRLARTAQRLKDDGIETVIFAADEVLGFRGGVDDVADAFKESGIVFGMVEFAKQKGELKLAKQMMPNVVRVHSITAAEMGTMDRPTAVERFVKAARERDVRLAYVRMFDLGSTDPLQANIDYISSIKSRLIAQGLGVGVCRPFDQPTLISEPAALPLAPLSIGLGIIAGIYLLMAHIWPFWKTEGSRFACWSLPLRFLLAVAITALSAMVILGPMFKALDIAAKLLALIAALVFPTLAVIYAASGSPAESTKAPLRTYLWRAIARFIGVVAISGAGGLMIAALLSRREFMLRIDQFAGVKFAHFLPILLVAFAFAAGIAWVAGSWQEQKERVISNLRRLASEPVLVWQTAIALALLVMVAIVLARSGNDSGVGVSSLELRFRSLLDSILFVRPRTKEFLIGHPALFLGIAAALGGRRSWAALLLVVGMIGEVSLINTFCHIHTPIAISVARSIIGAVIGLAIGILLLLILGNRGQGIVVRGCKPRTIKD